jgi:acyl phosphate:glycerol-3-phosphate acyltransferase
LAGMAELADAEDLKSSGAILVGSSPSPGTRQGRVTVFVVLLSYLIGSFPTAYVAGRVFRGKDIRDLGDGNMGAQNAFRHLSPAIGIAVGLIDAAKGFLVMLVAQGAGLSQMAVFVAGGAAVAGHNWPVLLGFRGGRGEATTIGILLNLLTVPVLIAVMPSIVLLVLRRNVVLSTAGFVVLLVVVCLWRSIPVSLTVYAVALFILVAFTHLISMRRVATRNA